MSRLSVKTGEEMISCFLLCDGNMYINPQGHDAFCKGGRGDVLFGLIASFFSSRSNSRISDHHSDLSAEDRANTLFHYGVTPPDLPEGVRRKLKGLI